MSLPNCGTAPRHLENLRIGGGYGSTPDGGIDLDHAGNAALDGDLTVDGAIAYKGVLRADRANGGVNRDWSASVPLFTSEALSTASGPTNITFSTRMFFNAWDFPATTLQAINTNIMLPPDYDGSPLRLRLVWTSQAAKGGTSGNVLWRVYMRAYADGGAYANSNTFSDALDAFQGQDKFHLVDIVHQPENPGPGLPLSVTIRRIGNDATDTFDADAQLVKALISYA